MQFNTPERENRQLPVDRLKFEVLAIGLVDGITNVEIGVTELPKTVLVMASDAYERKPLEVYYERFGSQTVFIPVTLGTKKPKHQGWQRTSFEDSRAPAYQAELLEGNMGVLFGPASGDLVGVDCDSDEAADLLVRVCPEAETTLQTRGARGRTFFFRVVGPYPAKVIKIKDVKGQPIGEWRGGGGAQTVICGLHPSGCNYQILNGNSIQEIELTTLAWPEGWTCPWNTGPRPRDMGDDWQEPTGFEGRITAYMAKVPASVAGEHGDDQLFRAARILVIGWDLSQAEALPHLRDFNLRCQPPWPDERLRYKLKEADQKGTGERGHLRGEPAQEEEDLSWVKFETVDQLPGSEPERVIEGLLHIGEKLGITAGSKNFKTWLLLYIGYCIANGLDFLGFKTNQAKVIFFDLELSRNGLRRRLEKIKKAAGEGDFENIKVCALRGKAALFCKNFEKITARITEEGSKVVIIDPVYKFLLGKNESDNGLVADMLERLTVFCMEAEVSLIYVHHHSKGNQADKNSLDRSSGAGAWSRDPDSVLDLVDHKDSTKEEKIYSVEITVREFPPIDNFVVRWKFPLLIRDTEGLDPTELKQSKAGRPKVDANELIVAVARAFDEEGGITVKHISEAILISRRTVQRRIKENLIPERLVRAPLKNGYQLSLSERQKMEQFKTDEKDKDGTEK